MPRSPIIWGAGLSIALGSLPSLVLPPAFAAALPSVIDRSLPFDSASELKSFLRLPIIIRTIIVLGILAIIRAISGEYRRGLDRKRHGPEVVEVPRVKLKWPFNLDFIPFDMGIMRNGYCGATWEVLVAKYGNTFNLRLLEQDQAGILTVEPEVVKAVLSTDFNSYEKGYGFRRRMFSVLGDGVFNSDGKIWRLHRNMCRPYFTRERISHFENFARHSDLAISKLLSRLAEPNCPAVDFQVLASRFTLDSGTEFLFGKDVQSLSAALPYPHEDPIDDGASFGAAFARAQEHVTRRIGLAMFWPWMELFRDRTLEDMKIINAYVTPILRKQPEKGANCDDRFKPTHEADRDQHTLLDHLVSLTRDETVIRDEIINILVAARDTTATTLTFAVYMLSQHPEIMSRLRDEILQCLGTSSYPSPDDLKEMKYLRAVLNETLRLFPPVPVNLREASKSTVLKVNGKQYYIPAGTSVIWSTLLMHRRKDLWGTDADEFDPERWLDDRLKKYVTSNPFIFLPFNAGPRICLGQQFAYNEASFFLCRLLQRVESIELAPDAQPAESLPRPEWKSGTGRQVYENIWPKHHLTMYSDGGLWLRMKEAKPL
ncbi:cytochrome P450 family monooxygenase pc-3 [Rhizoctonia solani AG-3 Rhs1AP]|uniref:Cytochrome P450 family monooxygenase pc-3 n=2 Tax=Rhizoctonia solani AG-3 TaxID=1086053 RepID=A0A074RSP2_9AGAM|nr:cytochrome P450 family monooxygenase pc-3 [Rhizoctonia solani AG-3 Rhs1AP]KEP49884.1 cytochrome P450 family monooxygenase pc-3 [Rhizoctonia solani 123E]